jgi:hypothetical protein
LFSLNALISMNSKIGESTSFALTRSRSSI